MKIAVGSAANAGEFKLKMADYIRSLGHEVTDFGSDDPIYAHVMIKAAEAVASGKCERGVLFCGSGVGASVAAGKVPGAYVVCVNDAFQAYSAAAGVGANIITLGSEVTGVESAKRIIQTYLENSYKPSELADAKRQAFIDYEASKFKM